MQRQFMHEAIELALRGVRAGDGGPFGAVVVRDGEVVGRGWNRVVGGIDPTAHAEVEAIRDAARRLGRFHLDGCALYTTCEPCPMCLGAAYWAHIGHIYYAMSGEDAAAIGFSDRWILAQLRDDPASRAIRSEQVMREAALGLWQEWQQTEQRREY